LSLRQLVVTVVAVAGINASVEVLGERLRGARDRVGLTLEQTAELSGLSKAHLSRLESGERQPSIAALVSLAGALGTSVTHLLGEDRDEKLLATSRGDEPRRASNGLFIASCSGYSGSSALEALRITVAQDRPAGPGVSHPGEEWLYILRGTLSLEYEGEFHRLAVDMTAHFDAERPHRLIAEDGPVELLLVTAKESRRMHSIH
jgi:transcriptional regulator with XRE-family HTH domain